MHDEAITSSRNAHVPSKLHKHALEQRAVGAIFTAALTQHATMRLFTAEVIFGGKRHQQFAVVVLLLMRRARCSSSVYAAAYGSTIAARCSAACACAPTSAAAPTRFRPAAGTRSRAPSWRCTSTASRTPPFTMRSAT
jgi:hypothetical protein